MNIVEIESSRPFMDRLFSGTLLSLVDRVEDDGFCETCFGELGGVKQYSTSHFPRDTAEAAWVLADCGRVDLGLRILSFTFNHIPHGQDYIPHVLARDGSVRSNAFQTDTLAHLARTLSRCAELTADQNIVHDMYRKLKPIADALWKGRFHPEWNLLDSGNFNEQGFCGTNEPLLDMFSNASCHAGFNAMGELAKRFGEDDVSEVNYLRAERLATGMEKTLYDPDQGVYSAAVTLDNQRMDLFNWLSIYTWRWYPGTSATYKRAFDKLWNETCNNWGRFSIPSCEPPHIRLRTLGKVVATLLSYSAENLETERLTTLLDFIEATVKKPDNLWPEFWYHHAPGPNDAEYYRNFLPRHAHVWTPYMENPDGDYTVDSGNCEQSSVFVSEYLNSVVGCRSSDGVAEITPPVAAFSKISISNRPVVQSGKTGFISYKFLQNSDGIRIEVSCDIALSELRIRLPLRSIKKCAPPLINGVHADSEFIANGDFAIFRVALEAGMKKRNGDDISSH